MWVRSVQRSRPTSNFPDYGKCSLKYIKVIASGCSSLHTLLGPRRGSYCTKNVITAKSTPIQLLPTDDMDT